jgi:hypothetical protein
MLRLAQAQTRNGLLLGDELAAAAHDAASVAARTSAQLVAADRTGERIIGAALALAPNDCRPADLTHRVDGQSLLLISGVVAGPYGLAEAAARLKSLGARTVVAAVLGGWSEPIVGIETITTLGAPYIRPAQGATAMSS